MKNQSALSPYTLAFLVLLMLIPAVMQAQDPMAIGLQDSLDAFNGQRLRTNRVGMTVLGGWAVANIGFSGLQYFRTEGQAKGFHQMTVMWNLVNLGLAAGGLIGSGPDNPWDGSSDSVVTAQIENCCFHAGWLSIVMTGSSG